MKQRYISDFKVSEDITTTLLVKNIAIKVGSNRKAYLDLLLGDCTGEINGKKWDIAEEEAVGLQRITPNSVIKVRALVTEWNGMRQLRISRIRMTGPQDTIDMNDYIKAAPEDPQAMYDYIRERAEAFADPDLRCLCTEVLSQRRDKLMYYPAAQKNHHAEMAGLLYHVKRMLMTAEKVCEVYTNLDRELLMAGVILHDIEKIDEIESNELGISPGYSFEGKMLGHLVLGVREIEKTAERLGLPREKTVMLEHMMLSHHYEPEFGSPKKPLFPEAEMLHYLDMIDAKMFDMQEVLEQTEPGKFSEKIWTLNNRTLYRREEKNHD
ncbi:MAG: HD domain-containing protein [Bacillota bacterium]|nr:HD domain-containing protein [Bacillota bacterium]